MHYTTRCSPLFAFIASVAARQKYLQLDAATATLYSKIEIIFIFVAVIVVVQHRLELRSEDSSKLLSQLKLLKACKSCLLFVMCVGQQFGTPQPLMPNNAWTHWVGTMFRESVSTGKLKSLEKLAPTTAYHYSLPSLL